MSRKKEVMTESTGQKWAYNSYSKKYYDQFHFEILPGKMKTLMHHGVEIIKLHSVMACKEVSKIILNDMIYRRTAGNSAVK